MAAKRGAVTADGRAGHPDFPRRKVVGRVWSGRTTITWSLPTAANPSGFAGRSRGDELIQWSADGRFLYVRGSNESVVELFRIDLFSGQREPWKTLEVPDKVGFVGIENGPGAIRITPDGKSYVYTYWQALGELYIAEGLK